MGTDYAWVNHSLKEYCHEGRWYRSGRCKASIAWLCSSRSDHRWKPEHRIELVITDTSPVWEEIAMDDDAQWLCVDSMVIVEDVAPLRDVVCCRCRKAGNGFDIGTKGGTCRGCGGSSDLKSVPMT